MVRATSNGPTAASMMVNGNRIWSMVKVVRSGRMVHSKTVSGRKTIDMGKVSSYGLMDLTKKVSSVTTANKAMGALSGQRASTSKKAHGSKTWSKAGDRRCSVMVTSKMVTRKMAKSTAMAGMSGRVVPFKKVSRGIIKWMARGRYFGEMAEGRRGRWTTINAKGMVSSNGKTEPGRLANSKLTADTAKVGLSIMMVVSTMENGWMIPNTDGAHTLLKRVRRLKVCGRMVSRYRKRKLKRKNEYRWI